MKNKNFYSRKELLNLNVVVGKNCQISKKVSFYSKEIKIGNRCRIDDDVVLKGKIQLKNNVHISRGCTLSGDEKGIFMDDFSGLSNYVQIFSTSDSPVPSDILVNFATYFTPEVSAISNTDTVSAIFTPLLIPLIYLEVLYFRMGQ